MLKLSALGVDVLSTLWADNAQAPRASFSELDKIFSENFVLFEIRAIRKVVRVVTRIIKLVLSEQL